MEYMEITEERQKMIRNMNLWESGTWICGNQEHGYVGIRNMDMWESGTWICGDQEQEEV